MPKYHVNFQLGTSVEAENENEAVELALNELRNPDYDDFNVTLEE